jgi:predicted neutral ceramidase superfamily lipid hydrolase
MEKKRLIGSIVGLVGVIFGLIAIFKIIQEPEIATGFITLSFGILAIIWTAVATKSLSKGSSLKQYTINYLACIIFIVLYTFWNTLGFLLGWKQQASSLLIYPSYIFLILAFLVFVSTSYQILSIGKEFGFKSQSKNIEKIINQRKKKITN